MIIRQWTGREACALQAALRMSVRGFASYLGMSYRAVAAWHERGETIVPKPDVQAMLDTALLRSDEATRTRFTLLVEDQEEGATNRREATRAIAVAVGAAIQPSAASALAWAADRRRIDSQVLKGHQSVAASLAGLYRSADPRAALPMTRAYARDLRDAVGNATDDGIRRDLLALVAGVHAQIGLWECHLSNLALARRDFSVACEYASATREALLAASVFAATGYAYSSAPRGGTGGEPPRALALFDHALRLAGAHHSFTRGWISTWRADQQAALGNTHAAAHDIESAHKGLASRNDPVPGFFARSSYGYGMKGHLDSVEALVDTVTGHTDAGSFDGVVKEAANQRRIVATEGHRALAHVMTGNPEAACHALDTALTLGDPTGYRMGLLRAAGVRAQFNARWQTLGAVKTLDEHWHHVLSSPTSVD